MIPKPATPRDHRTRPAPPRRLALLALLLAGAPAARADLPSTSQPFRSTFTGVKNDFEYRIPAMVVSNQGTVIVSCDGRFSNADVPGRIDNVIRRSTDNGNTWGLVIVTAGYGTDTADTDIYPIVSTTTAHPRTSASDPALLVDRTGNGADVPAGRIWVFYDNGSTVSYNGFGRTIKLEMRYSDDHGATWQRGGICGKGVGEVQIVELADGSLLSTMRPSGAGNGYRWFTKSTDGGATWTPLGSGATAAGMTRFDATTAWPVPDPTCQGSIFRLSATTDSAIGRRIASDKCRLVHANCDSTSSSRVKMTVRVSHDEGLSWPASRLVYTATGGYCALARLATGDIGLLYEKDGFAAIDFVRITLPEATNDTDNQPEYNRWANSKFTLAQLMDPAVSGRAADPDLNGLTNYQEYQAAVAGRPTVGIAASTGVACQMEVSGDLATWQSTEDTDVHTEAGTPGSLVVSDLTPVAAAPRRYIRLRVTPL